MTEKDTLWNSFIEEICDRDAETLSLIQKKAVLCFWYDAEMQNGGHSGYRDCYLETNPDELADALSTVANKDIADNYRQAITIGEEDDFEETDNAYYDFEPSLCDCLEEFVWVNKNVIFD